MRGNFGEFIQRPAVMDTDFKYTAFQFLIKDIYVDPTLGNPITICFDKRMYKLGFSFTKRPAGQISHWCRLQADFTLTNSHKFIELCHRFLDTLDTEMDVLTDRQKIDPYWVKLKYEVFVSI